MKQIKNRWRYISPYLQKYRFSIALGIVFVVLSTALDQVSPWMIKIIIDRLSHNEIAGAEILILSLLKLLGLPLGIILASSALSAVLLFFQRWLVITASRKIEYKMRGDLFSKFQSQPKIFTDSNKIGDLMSYATNDLDRIRDFLGPVILHLARMPFIILFTLLAVFLLNPKLALVGLIPVFILPLFVNKFLRRMHRLYGQIQKNLGNLNSFIQDSISGIQVIKAYAAENEIQSKFENASENLRDSSIKVSYLTSAMWPLIGGLASLGVLIAVWYGSALAVDHEISLGTLTAAIIYLLKLQFPLAGLGWVANLYQRASASMDRLIDLEKKFHAPDEKGNSLARAAGPPPSLKNLELREVSFAYGKATAPALHEITLNLLRGSHLGIVGPTGSGKSTLIHIICGIYSPPPQQLFLNGKPREAFTQDQWRSYFSLSPQDGFLFSTTIKENIALGRQPDSRLDVKTAGMFSAFDKDLSQIPGGYQALLGERGINLSGGQRQRVGLARAMIANAQVLCLDDTLSALDTETEAGVLENLRNHFAGKTLIIVAHRYSAVKDCDHIIYLEDGRIAESGTHDELVNRDGKYASVYAKQQLSEALERT